MPVNIRFVGALAVAAAGLAAGFITAGSRNDPGEIERAAGVPASLAKTPPALLDRLQQIHRALAIRPDQETAWQRYADTLFRLDRSSRDLLQRVASGEAQDDGTERIVHALELGAAFSELEKDLSPGQSVQARVLTQAMTGDLICRDLADSHAR